MAVNNKKIPATPVKAKASSTVRPQKTKPVVKKFTR